ncbi:DNA-binding CsgD family transcriptional regulator [Thermocatellispora tengchongensis]|uniref:DNA-binding CsgD family transcriptional regulator n=3 Tax=Thermocatellispora tengchongensis TaxID=1073253 RepID=A0A840PE11_9ACTN|nr:LuxR family transcriptional regulator [Thermocatellispora tengchongensis]MBB5136081.1 DNA-binding CsgD family transcriptional regulator [Thermocatellispora tengchongensis]
MLLEAAPVPDERTPLYVPRSWVAMAELGRAFVGRRTELGRIAAAMRHPDLSGAALIGEGGVGKSRLLTEAVRQVCRRHHFVVCAAACQATSSVPFGAFAQHLPPEFTGTAFNGGSLRLAADALIGRAGGRKPVLVIDDVHLLDPASLALAFQMARRHEAFVLAATHSAEAVPDPITGLWTSGMAEWIEVRPFSREEVGEVLEHALGGPAEGMLVQRCWEATGGKAFLLRELVAAMLETGTLAPADGVWRASGPFPVTLRLAGVVDRRLAGLGDDCRRVLELLAFGGPLSPDVPARLVSRPAVEAVEALGIVEVTRLGDREQARLTPSLYGEVLRARTPRLRARRVREELAAALEAGPHAREDLRRVVAWRLENGVRPPAESVVAAMRDAWAHLDHELSAELAAHAVAAGQGTRAAEPLGYGLMFLGRAREAEERLARLPRPAAERDRARLACVRAFNLAFGLDSVRAARALLHSALRDVAGVESRAEPAAVLALLDVATGRCRAGAGLAEKVMAEAPHDSRAHCVAEVARAVALAFLRPPEESFPALERAREPALRHQAELPWLEFFLELGWVHACLLTGDFPRAQARAAAAYDRAVERRFPFAIAWFCLLRALAARARGELREQLHRCREGVAIARELGNRGLLALLLGQLAHGLALSGQTAAAREALAEADEPAQRSLWLLQPWTELARSWVAAAGGSPGASAIAERAAALARESGAAGFESLALHEVARLGEPGHVLDRLGELAGRAGGDAAPQYAAHAAALVTGDGDALAASSAGLERLGSPLLAAEAAAEEANRHRAAGNLAAAAAAAARALRLAGPDGARTPALEALERPRLTRREREIAELAAAGMSSKEISLRFVLSVRTVENHLQRVYRKLGIGDRAELASLLDLFHPGSHPASGGDMNRAA